MKGHGAKFNRKKEAAITGLLTTRNHEEAARVAGIHVKTLKRWLRLPEFQAELLQVRRDAMSQANARIQHNAGALVSLGLKLAASDGTPAAVRAHLALGLLDRGNQSVDRDDILVRLEALERAAEEAKNRR
ncbi:MAG TPA: hypothetical protein VMI94_08635 [Bryobacteraceae bacterium]|nr:hypothetical protein [Bryobacteraceae bacterium]